MPPLSALLPHCCAYLYLFSPYLALSHRFSPLFVFFEFLLLFCLFQLFFLHFVLLWHQTIITPGTSVFGTCCHLRLLRLPPGQFVGHAYYAPLSCCTWSSNCFRSASAPPYVASSPVCRLCAAFNPWLVSHPLDHLRPTASINYCFCFCQYPFPNFLYPLNCFCCFRLLARGYVIRLFLFYSAFAPSFFPTCPMFLFLLHLFRLMHFLFTSAHMTIPVHPSLKAYEGSALRGGYCHVPCQLLAYALAPLTCFPSLRRLSRTAATFPTVPPYTATFLSWRSDVCPCAPTISFALRRFLVRSDVFYS